MANLKNTSNYVIGTYNNGRVLGASNNEIGTYGNGRILNTSNYEVGTYGNGRILNTSNYEIGRYGGGRILDTSNYEIGTYDGSDEGGAAAALLLLLNSEQVSSSSGSGSSKASAGLLAALGGIFLFLSWFCIKAPFEEISLVKNKKASSRLEWWLKCIRSLIFATIFTTIIYSMFGKSYNLSKAAIIVREIVGYIIFIVFGVWPIIAVSIRRILDIGKQIWWVFVPIANIIMCGFIPGEAKFFDESGWLKAIFKTVKESL